MATCTSKTTFSLPPEWNDNERMRFMLSPFPPNITIKYDDSKVKFWRSLIISSCKQLKRLSFTEDQLVERFYWNTFRPRCLGPILDAMERQGDIQKKADVIGANEGWMRWGVNVLSKPISWLWGNAATRTCVVEYVLQGTVKVQWNQRLRALTQSTPISTKYIWGLCCIDLLTLGTSRSINL